MLKNMVNDNWIDRCCYSIDFDKENRRTIYDFTEKAGALFSGSYDIYNKKKQMVQTVYIKEVIYNKPATIVIWSDGTKTITRCSKEDNYDREVGLLYCVLKKLSTNSIDELCDQWLPIQENLIDEPIKVTLKDIRKNSK